MALVGDGVLAVTKSVPQLDGAVARAGNDLAVVGGEGDGEDVVGVADETAGSLAGGQLPQAQGLVPGRRQSVGAIRGDHAVGDDVRVTVQRALWVAVGLVAAGQVPDDQSLVTRGGEKHVGAGASGQYALAVEYRA